MNPWFWLVICVVLILIEICTLALTTIWFAFGAAAALVVNLIFDNVTAECIVFVVVSAAFLFLLRPSCIRRFNLRRTPTNVDTMIGSVVRVVVPIDNKTDSGRVVHNGMEWSARSEDDAVTIAEGKQATVVRVEGVKLIVKSAEV